MNKPRILIIVLVLLVLLTACDFANFSIDLWGSGEEEAHDEVDLGGMPPIEVGIDSPTTGSMLPMGSVNIAYHATSEDGVTGVELSVDGEVLNAYASPDSDQPIVALRYTWQPTVAGSHTIRVRAQNHDGAWSDFATATVTIEGAPQQVAPQQEQAAPQPAQPEPTDTPEPTATPDKMTIFDIKHDKDKFYYGGSGCGSKEITISARLTHPDKAYAVVLFTRFYDKEGEGLSKWAAGKSLSKKGDDLWSATLISNQIPNYNMFEYTIMEYQIVVQDKPVNGSYNRLAASEVIKKVTMEICP